MPATQKGVKVPAYIREEVLAAEDSRQWGLLQTLCKQAGIKCPQPDTWHQWRHDAGLTKRQVKMGDDFWARVLAAAPASGTQLEIECQRLGVTPSPALYRQLAQRLSKV